MAVTSGAIAQGVTSTNYSEFDIDTAPYIAGRISGSSAFEFNTVDLTIELGNRLVSYEGELAFAPPITGQTSVALLFSQDVCEVGFSVIVQNHYGQNRHPVRFTFFGRDGEILAEEVRHPPSWAQGLGFAADQFEPNFAGVMISAAHDARLRIFDAISVVCAPTLS